MKKLAELPIEIRKDIADEYLIKIETDGEKDLEDSMPDEPIEDIGEGDEGCAECGSFANYAESRGYTKESIMEASDDELNGVISGYANAFNEGMNDGDADNVAAYVNEEMVMSLVENYGHDAYVNEVLKPATTKLSESTEEDKMLKISEAWGGGLRRAGKFIGNAIGKGASDVAGKVGNTVGNAASAVGRGVGNAASAVGRGVQNVKQEYNKGVQNDAVKKVQQLALELKSKIEAMNAATAKAGGEPADLNTILDIIKNSFGDVPANIANNPGASAAYKQGKVRNLGSRAMKETLNEEDDLSPEIDDTDIPEIDEPISSEPITDNPMTEPTHGFGAEQSMGVVTPSTSAVDVSVDAQNKTVNVTMNEAKIRKYVQNRILELAGKKKGNIE